MRSAAMDFVESKKARVDESKVVEANDDADSEESSLDVDEVSKPVEIRDQQEDHYFCNQCRVFLNSNSQWQDHLTGKKHRAKAQRLHGAFQRLQAQRLHSAFQRLQALIESDTEEEEHVARL